MNRRIPQHFSHFEPAPDEMLVLHDDFEAVEGMVRAHNGGGEHPTSDWAKLSAGKTLGKRTVLQFFTDSNGNFVPVEATNIFEVGGEDCNAQQLCITVMPPGQTLSASGLTTQNVSSYQDNIDITASNNGVGGNVNSAGGAASTDFTWANTGIILDWGIGGVFSRAEIDVHNGMSISITASRARLRAFIEAVGIAPPNSFYTIGAYIGPGTARSGFATAQRTIFIPSTAINVESQVFSVPRFARAVTLVGANAAHDLYSGAIRFWRSPGGSADGLLVADMFFSGNNQVPMPIPNGAYYFSVVPGLAVINAQQAIFQLAI